MQVNLYEVTREPVTGSDPTTLGNRLPVRIQLLLGNRRLGLGLGLGLGLALGLGLGIGIGIGIGIGLLSAPIRTLELAYIPWCWASSRL